MRSKMIPLIQEERKQYMTRRLAPLPFKPRTFYRAAAQKLEALTE